LVLQVTRLRVIHETQHHDKRYLNQNKFNYRPINNKEHRTGKFIQLTMLVDLAHILANYNINKVEKAGKQTELQQHSALLWVEAILRIIFVNEEECKQGKCGVVI